VSGRSIADRPKHQLCVEDAEGPVSNGAWNLFCARGIHAGEVRQRDQATGSSRSGQSQGRTYHCALESNGAIQVFDVWESQQDFDAFGATLIPILTELGVELKDPMIATVHNVIMG
jgi:hypothetical protein